MRVAFVNAVVVGVVALASSATATPTYSNPLSHFAKSGGTDDAAPSHSYTYERGYARFVDDEDAKGSSDDERRRRRLEFVRVEPSDGLSSPPRSAPSPSSPSPWTPPREAVAWVEYVDASVAASVSSVFPVFVVASPARNRRKKKK